MEVNPVSQIWSTSPASQLDGFIILPPNDNVGVNIVIGVESKQHKDVKVCIHIIRMEF